MSHYPLLAVLVSLLAAGAILLSDRRPNVREAWTFVAAAVKFLLVVSMLPTVPGRRRHRSYLRRVAARLVPAPARRPVRPHLRPARLRLVDSHLHLFNRLHARRALHSPDRLFACFAVCLSATMGIAFAGNLITFFLFYEMLTLATYPLVVHDRTEEAVSAGRKYLAYTLGAGQLLLLAIVAIAILAPGASFQPGGFLMGKAPLGVLGLVFVLGLIGVGAKGAINAVAQLAAGRHGGADSGKRVAACRGGSQGRNLRLPAAGALRVRR